MIRKFGKRKKDPMAELAEQYARPRAIEFNVADDQGHVNDTGVRFEDVAGIDRVKSSVVEVIKMMRGDEKFDAIGAHAPRVSVWFCVCFSFLFLFSRGKDAAVLPAGYL